MTTKPAGETVGNELMEACQQAHDLACDAPAEILLGFQITLLRLAADRIEERMIEDGRIYKDETVTAPVILPGMMLIEAERQRQIESEGWSADHDDEHAAGKMALAAVCYATPVLLYERIERGSVVSYADPWPWEDSWDKRPKDGNVILPNGNESNAKRIRQLVKAGALIAAEIDRHLRESEMRDEAERQGGSSLPKPKPTLPTPPAESVPRVGQGGMEFPASGSIEDLFTADQVERFCAAIQTWPRPAGHGNNSGGFTPWTAEEDSGWDAAMESVVFLMHLSEQSTTLPAAKIRAEVARLESENNDYKIGQRSTAKRLTELGVQLGLAGEAFKEFGWWQVKMQLDTLEKRLAELKAGVREILRDNLHLIVPNWDEDDPDIVAAVSAEISDYQRRFAELQTANAALEKRLAEAETRAKIFDTACADMSAAADAMREHFSDGKIKGDGKWRLTEIAKHAERIDEVFGKAVEALNKRDTPPTLESNHVND